jgi:hypothetical protein
MNYNDFLEQIKELEFEELREDQTRIYGVSDQNKPSEPSEFNS